MTCRQQPDNASFTTATVTDRRYDHVNDLSSGTPDDGSVPVLMAGNEVVEDQTEDTGNSGSSNDDTSAPLTTLYQAEYE